MPVTFTARLKGITEFGHDALSKSKPFCALLRTLVKSLQSGKPLDKPALGARFDIPARMYNTAKVAAEGIIKGTLECQKVALEDVNIDIARQVVEAFHSPSGELAGRVRKLTRLYRKRNRLLKQLIRCGPQRPDWLPGQRGRDRRQ